MKKRERQLVEEVRAYCREHADPAQAGKWARYFSEGYDAWGLLTKDHPFFTTQRDAWLGKYSSLGLDGFLSAGAELCKSGKYEEGAIATSFLKSRLPEFDSRALPSLSKWFDDGIRNWAHVDVLCLEVLAPALQAGRITRDALAPWRASPWKYQRRTSVVALIPPVPAEIPAVLASLRPLMRDEEKPVQQALGWILREAWKLEKKPVEAFLLEFVATAPRQIYQTATEKMTPAQKERFRRPARPKARAGATLSK
jgi:3-methyladenine DNA glycosylase AlkD